MKNFIPKRIVGVVGVIVLLTGLVMPHELGHFFAARSCGVIANRISLGFGPVVYSHWVGDVELAISAIPLGGYVNIVNNLSSRSLSEDEIKILKLKHPVVWRNLSNPEHWLSNQSPLVIFFISISGALVNFLSALICIPVLRRYIRRGDLTLDNWQIRIPRGKKFIGPISIFRLAYEAVGNGWPATLALYARFSLGIGALQLAPLPFMDGLKAVSALVAIVLSARVSQILISLLLIVIIVKSYRLASKKLFQLGEEIAMLSMFGPVF